MDDPSRLLPVRPRPPPDAAAAGPGRLTEDEPLSETDLREIIARMATDPTFATWIRENPEVALRGSTLTVEERGRLLGLSGEDSAGTATLGERLSRSSLVFGSAGGHAHATDAQAPAHDPGPESHVTPAAPDAEGMAAPVVGSVGAHLDPAGGTAGAPPPLTADVHDVPAPVAGSDRAGALVDIYEGWPGFADSGFGRDGGGLDDLAPPGGGGIGDIVQAGEDLSRTLAGIFHGDQASGGGEHEPGYKSESGGGGDSGQPSLPQVS